MKKRHKETLISIALITMVVLSGIGIAKAFTLKKTEVIEKKEIIANNNLKGTSIKKTETEDYYYYNIEDYDRDLSYSWKFQKDKNQKISVEESLNIDADLRLSLNALTKDTKTIESKVEQKKLIITFDHHGKLPLEATVRVNVSNRFQENDKLYLYYYNPEKDQIEYIAHNVEVENGYVEFTISHCSDYFLTAAVVNDAVGNPKSINYIIIGLIVVVFILVAITLLQSKNK